MAVAANDRGPRQREALLRPDDMHDALPAIQLVVILDPEFRRVIGQRLHLQLALRVVDPLGAIRRRHVMVDDGERLVRRTNLTTGHPQALECLRARHLVDEMPIDIDDACAIVLLIHQMVVEDLVVKRLGHVRVFVPRSWF